MKYIIITPVKNECLYFKETLESVCNQNIKPEKWIIVDDESTDGTSELIAKYASKYNYIEHHKMINFRPDLNSIGGRSGALMNYARSLISEDADYIVKIDADISFEPDFFEKLFFEFEKDPDLGIASGHLVQDGKPEKLMGRNHNRGATRIYTKSCFDTLGHYENRRGEDTMDTFKAQYLGYTTKTFDIYFNHLKPEDKRNGNFFKHWETGVYKGWIPYNFVYFSLTLVKSLFQWPYFISSFLQFSGYVYSRFISKTRPFDSQVCRYIRNTQKEKIKNFNFGNKELA